MSDKAFKQREAEARFALRYKETGRTIFIEDLTDYAEDEVAAYQQRVREAIAEVQLEGHKYHGCRTVLAALKAELEPSPTDTEAQ